MIRCAYCSSLVASSANCPQCGGPLSAGRVAGAERKSVYEDSYQQLLAIFRGAQNPSTIGYERIEQANPMMSYLDYIGRFRP